MPEFNNEAYRALVDDLINDTFYLKGASRRGTIANIRKCAEVVVRKILDLSPSEPVELGNGKLQKKIKDKNNPLLLNAVKTINSMGSKCTHTQLTREVTEDDLAKSIDCLFDLYPSILIEYFEKYEFGSNLIIVSKFSILPPIIRYITLNYLYEKYPSNLMVIDKLSLVLLKALNEDAAISWIEDRKSTLEKTHSVTEQAYKKIVEKYGEEAANLIYYDAPNMYDLCIGRVKSVANVIKQKGPFYNDFESAIDVYKKEGIASGTSAEIVEFNSIMQFLYLGRKSKKELN